MADDYDPAMDAYESWRAGVLALQERHQGQTIPIDFTRQELAILRAYFDLGTGEAAKARLSPPDDPNQSLEARIAQSIVFGASPQLEGAIREKISRALQALNRAATQNTEVAETVSRNRTRGLRW